MTNSLILFCAKSGDMFCLCFSSVLFILIFFGIFGVGQDWAGYDQFFDITRNVGLSAFGETRFEPAFIVTSVFLTKIFSSNIFVFALLAAISFFLKIKIISVLSLSKYILICVSLFYTIRFAPLLEMTQLRAACSSSLVMVSFLWAWEHCRIRSAFALVAAFSFHFSAALLAPFILVLLFQSRRPIYLNRSYVIIFSLMLLFLTKLFSDAVIDFIENLFFIVSMYKDVGFGDGATNPLSLALVLDWLFILVNLIAWRSLTPMMRYVLFLEMIGMAIFYGAIRLPVVAHRFRELLTIFWVFYLLDAFKQKKNTRHITNLFLFGNFILYFYIYVFSGKFFL